MPTETTVIARDLSLVERRSVNATVGNARSRVREFLSIASGQAMTITTVDLPNSPLASVKISLPDKRKDIGYNSSKEAITAEVDFSTPGRVVTVYTLFPSLTAGFFDDNGVLRHKRDTKSQAAREAIFEKIWQAAEQAGQLPEEKITYPVESEKLFEVLNRYIDLAGLRALERLGYPPDGGLLSSRANVEEMLREIVGDKLLKPKIEASEDEAPAWITEEEKRLEGIVRNMLGEKDEEFVFDMIELIRGEGDLIWPITDEDVPWQMSIANVAQGWNYILQRHAHILSRRPLLAMRIEAVQQLLEVAKDSVMYDDDHQQIYENLHLRKHFGTRLFSRRAGAMIHMLFTAYARVNAIAISPDNAQEHFQRFLAQYPIDTSHIISLNSMLISMLQGLGEGSNQYDKLFRAFSKLSTSEAYHTRYLALRRDI